MTLPPVIRIFFAIDLPEDIKKTLGSFIGTLKKNTKSNLIRWTKPENLHVTLQFLAEAHAEHIPLLMEKVRAEIGQAHLQIHFTFDSVSLFPNPYRPRVIVLNIAAQESLIALSERIGRGIQAANYTIEDRPFRAHLTLGRIRHAQDARLPFLSACRPPALAAVPVNEIVLFRSEPQPEGSKYMVLDKILII